MIRSSSRPKMRRRISQRSVDNLRQSFSKTWKHLMLDYLIWYQECLNTRTRSLSLSKKSLKMVTLMRTKGRFTSIGISLIALRVILMASSSHKRQETKMPKMKQKALSQVKAQLRERRIKETLLFGRTQSQVSLAGIHHGVKVDQDGILSALLWFTQYLKNTQLIFIQEEKT